MTDIFIKGALKRECVQIESLGGDSVEVTELSLKARAQVTELYTDGKGALVPAVIAVSCVPCLAEHTQEDIETQMNPDVVQELASAVMRLSGMVDDDAKKN